MAGPLYSAADNETTLLTQNAASAHTDQDVSGYLVRRTSGAQSTNGSTRLRTGPGLVPYVMPAFRSTLLVVRKRMKAVITSATKTRSTPRRCSRGERGVGGSVTPAAIVAAIRLLMP